MKILKNSTYEQMQKEIEEGKEEIQKLKQQIKVEIGERAKAIEQKRDADKVIERLEKENSNIREDYSRVLAENTKLKNQLEQRNPKRGQDGRFAKKKDNE